MGEGRGGEKGKIRGAPDYLKKKKRILLEIATAHSTTQAATPCGARARVHTQHKSSSDYAARLPSVCRLIFFFFFFQAEDGIRDWSVTGVQTCALPIWLIQRQTLLHRIDVIQ